MDSILGSPATRTLLGVLRGHVRIEGREREGHLQRECDALVVRLSSTSDPDEQRRVRIALDLLHTLWTLDRDAWQRAMEEAVGAAISTSLVTERVAPLTVTIRVENPAEIATRAHWETLLSPTVTLIETEASIKQDLIRAYGQHKTAQLTATSAIPLRLQFQCWGLVTSEVQSLVTSVVDMVESVRGLLGSGTSTDGAPDMCAPLALESLDLDLTQSVMTSGIARQLIRLRAAGVRFRSLEIRLAKGQYETNHGMIDQEDDTADRDRLLTVLLGPVEANAATPVVTEGYAFAIETLRILRADLAQFRAACTALESTRVVKNLKLWHVFTDDLPPDRAPKWEWLTRALFAPSSRTSIKHLTLFKTDIRMRDVDTVVSTLQAVQGSGGDHALEELMINCLTEENPVTIEATPRLLAWIGHGILKFTFSIWRGFYRPDWAARIHRACPNLRSLHVDGGSVDSMDMFLTPYESNACQIETLELFFVEAPNESMAAFAVALSDRRYNISRVLRELCLGFVGEENGLDEAGLDAFLALLASPCGSRLEYLAMSMQENSWLAYQSRFELHHKTWGTGVAALVPLACKTAFLSVCRLPLVDGREEVQSSTPSRTLPLA